MNDQREFALGSEVQPARLRLAMALGGFPTFAALESESGLSSDTLRGWSKGRVERPSLQSRMAVESALPVRYEFLTDPTALPHLHSVNFRSLQATEETERNRMRACMVVLAITSRTLLGQLPMQLRALTSPAEGAERNAGIVAAGRFRARLELGADPAPNLVELAESLGITVAYGPRQSSSIDACSGWAGQHPLIVLNPAKGDYYRQRWDVAHELGHLVMHAQSRPDNNRTCEAQADGFAEGLLFPPYNGAVGALKELIRSDLPFSKILEMQEAWGTSADALLQVAGRGARDPLKTALERRRSERLSLAPKNQAVGSPRVPEQPTTVRGAVEAFQELQGSPTSVLAYDLGLKVGLLSALSAQTPADARDL